MPFQKRTAPRKKFDLLASCKLEDIGKTHCPPLAVPTHQLLVLLGQGIDFS